MACALAAAARSRLSQSSVQQAFLPQALEVCSTYFTQATFGQPRGTLRDSVCQHVRRLHGHDQVGPSVDVKLHDEPSEHLAVVTSSCQNASVTAWASARRTDVNYGQLRAELPCAPTFSERAATPHRNFGLRKDPPTDREAVLCALAEEVLSCALPRELPLQIVAHGALAPYAPLAGRSAALRPARGHIPDSALLFLNSLGLALAAAELPLRGGMLAAVRVMKRGEAGRVLVNPSPTDLRDASAQLLYVACPQGPLAVLYDTVGSMNGRTRTRPFAPPMATTADMLEAADAAALRQMDGQSQELERWQVAKRTAGEGAEAFLLRLEDAGAALGDAGTQHGTAALAAPWPSLQPSPAAQQTAAHIAQPLVEALLSQSHSARSTQLLGLANIEAAVRNELFLRGTVRAYGTPDGESAVMSSAMLPAAFAAAAAATVSDAVRGRGQRPCSHLAPGESRPLHAAMLSDPEGMRGVVVLAPAAAAVVSVGSTRVSATASLPQPGKGAMTHGNIPPLPEVAGSTRVALATPLRGRFPSDFRRDLLRSCLIEQALDCVDAASLLPMRVQLEVTSDDGGVLPAAIHAAALARINLGHAPRDWPGFAAVSLAGFGGGPETTLGAGCSRAEFAALDSAEAGPGSATLASEAAPVQSMAWVMDPNAIEEDTCTLQATVVVLPRVADTEDSLPEPPRAAWALLTAPRPGATARDVADAFAHAAAAPGQRLQEWAAAVDLSDSLDTASTAHDTGEAQHVDAALLARERNLTAAEEAAEGVAGEDGGAAEAEEADGDTNGSGGGSGGGSGSSGGDAGYGEAETAVEAAGGDDDAAVFDPAGAAARAAAPAAQQPAGRLMVKKMYSEQLRTACRMHMRSLRDIETRLGVSIMLWPEEGLLAVRAARPSAATAALLAAGEVVRGAGRPQHGGHGGQRGADGQSGDGDEREARGSAARGGGQQRGQRGDGVAGNV
eukprot:jgi/Ulvmu1/10916/UM007_0094.1